MQIVYASTSGNVEAVVEKITEVLKENHIFAQLHRAEQTPIDIIRDNEVFLLATSTWEHGEINPFFDRLLLEMKSENLSGKVAGFVGLGDLRYEQVLFCEGIEILKRAFIVAGGKEIHQTLKLNGEPYDILDTSVKAWAEGFIKTLPKNG